jgi:hypothetical protein
MGLAISKNEMQKQTAVVELRINESLESVEAF